MLSKRNPSQQSTLQIFAWSVASYVVVCGVGLFVVIALVVSLIPLFISEKSATVKPIFSELLSFSYDFIANTTDLSLPIDQLPAATLLLLQRYFQEQLDADPQTAGSIITVLSGTLIENLSASGKQNNVRLRLRLNARIQYAVRYNTPRSRQWALPKLSFIVSTGIPIFSRIRETIENGTGSTTIRVSVTPVTSSSNPTTAIPGRRRRRDIQLSTQMKSYMPIGGCLLIDVEQDSHNVIQYMYQKHTFVKYLPFGVEVLPSVDGEKINSYSFLQQNKLTKSAYDQLVAQNRPIAGHYLTMGALGCLEAHVHAWERVVELNQPMLILEDDIQLYESLNNMLPYLLYSLPTNFSLLYFGNLAVKDIDVQLMDYNEHLWKVKGSPWGTYAYLISPQAAATLLDFIYPIYAQIDSMIINIALSQSLDVYMSKQIFVSTDNKQNRESRVQRYTVSPIVIPKIFHFIWLSNNSLTGAAERNMELWKKYHPDWQIQLWTYENIYNSDLIIHNKQRFENSARSARQASDIIRYEIIHQYGGIYVDIDFEPLKSLEPLLHGINAFVVHENAQFICNGIYGAIPGHELSQRLIYQLESNWRSVKNGTINEETGPYHITKQVQTMQEENKANMKERFQILAPHLFFPYAWYENDPGYPYDSSAFAVHHFRPVAEIERDNIDRS